jgi:hypothetical protein
VPKLLIDEGGQASVFELFEDEVTIGRGASNAVQIADSHASKHHAAIRQMGGRLKLVDLESKNGVRVNGAFANQRWLEHGDTITIGAATMTFDASDVAARAARGGRTGTRAAVPAAAGAAAVATAPAPRRESFAPRPSAARRTRRPRDEEYEGDDEEAIVVPKRKSNSALIAVCVGGGLLCLVLLLFVAMAHSGAGSNAMALQAAKQLRAQGKDEEALRYLEQNADPKERDGYKSVEEEIRALKGVIQSKATAQGSEDAEAEYARLVRYKIELHKSDHSRETLAADLRAFAQKYMGTPAVQTLLNNVVDDMPRKLREIMGEDKAFAAYTEIFQDWKKWTDDLYAKHMPRETPNSTLGAKVLELQKNFAGSMKVYELERADYEPYPQLRALAGLK